MALPKLTVTLFPPRAGKAYTASGSLVIPLSDLHALAEWLLGQAGEYDDYKQQHVVRLLAFEYHNSSRVGTNYRTIQLRDPADLNSARPPAAGSMPQQAPLQAPNPADDHGDLPF
ncbi:MAG: hypothetical protein HQ469_12625 [Cyanobacteria bacterium]|nr:hypothetical protein [Cyanobacteria bacterium bin.275]